MKNYKVALVHDWLTGMRGGEKCLEVFCDLFPTAELFTLIHFPGTVSPKIESHKIYTSFLQKMPYLKNHYRNYLPLMPKAIESFQLQNYDLVISLSHCVAKGCKVSNKTVHVSYCLTPMRYVWDQFDQYFGRGQSGWMSSKLMKYLRRPLQNWDVQSSKNVTYFIAISNFIKERISNCYGRKSTVIYPPADTSFYTPSLTVKKMADYFLIVSALVPYKRVDLAVEAFNRSGLPLKIVGIGPMEKRLKCLAKSNVEFLGWRDNAEIKTLYQGCRGLIFTSEEDFGIVPVEAMACGKPVIAFGKGGALETVIEGKTGLFFKELTPQSLLNCLKRFDKIDWDPKTIQQHALNFSTDHFIADIKKFFLDIHIPL